MLEIALSAGLRSNLQSLRQNADQLHTTQERLATGRRVNSAVDDPTNFFAAANLTDRALLLEARLDGMGQSISTLKSADNAISSMRGIVSAMKGVVDEGLSSAGSSDRAALGKQFNELIIQLSDFAEDAIYKGVNLLKSSQADATSGGNELLKVQFTADFDGSTLEIEGVNIRMGDTVALDASGEITTASNMSSSSGAFAISFNDEGVADGSTSVVGIRSAEVSSSTETGAISASGTSSQIAWADNNSYRANLESLVVQIQAFDTSLINTLEEGADKLTLVDLNEEGANLLALQTSQQLGIQSLSLASQTNQSVLSLIG
jgi:flagellin-like hook-associated protein FlgL